jgi:DNA processing protein
MRSPYTIALANVKHFGQATHHKLNAAFSTSEDAWKANRNELLGAGLTATSVDAFLTWRTKHSPEEFVEQMATKNIDLVSIHDDAYPPLLRMLVDPPMYLFVRGTFPSAERHHLSIVGSRHCTKYGRDAAYQLSFDVAKGGVVVVSGLAYGIDEAAHRGTINAGGQTLAVLGSGLLGVDNTRHFALSDAIVASGGAVMSEFPLTAPPLPHHFPIRNRIVAGICRATLVIEAGLPSGSMITAQAAIDQNRDVYAIPGPIFSPTSKGTNFLLKDGAHLVTEARDIFELFGMNVAQNASATGTLPHGRNSAEIAFFNVLSAEPMHIDTIADKAGLSVVTASVAATQLEILGFIKDTGGKMYVRS